jgi:hypothetical protein
MSNQKITFENHRNIWNQEFFLRKTFCVPKGTKIEKDVDVLNFKRQINKIPKQKTYTIVGYGSLLNPSDIRRTMPSAKNHRLGLIDNYERIFNIGDQNSYMNVRSAPSKRDMNVALIDIDFEDLPNFIFREGKYNVVNVEVKESNGKEIYALMVIGKSIWENDFSSPLLNYLHLCLTGIKELAGLKGVQNFLRTTYCYSNTKNEHVLIEQWLKELDIVNYMSLNDYISR